MLTKLGFFPAGQFLPSDQQRAGQKNWRISAEADPQNQSQAEIFDWLTAQKEKGEKDKKHG